MKRELSSGLSEIYRKFAAKQEGNRIRRLEEVRKVERVKELFKQGANILEEFGETCEGTRVIAGQADLRGIRVWSPSVVLESEGGKVNFIMQGFKPNYISPKSPSPDSALVSISVAQNRV